MRARRSTAAPEGILAVLALLAVPPGPPAVLARPAGAGESDPLLTVAERSGFTRTARYDEVLDLARRLAGSPRIHLGEIGTTVEGRSIPLLVIADPPVTSAADLRGDPRLLVLLIGAIHGGEVCGKEALLMLARELAGASPGERRGSGELLRHLVIAMVPLLNADGNERISTEHRRRQNGPEAGTGRRENAAGLDLNRDWVKLEAPETRAVVRFLVEWDPAVVIDTHTTNGSYHRYGITYAGPKHPAGDRRLIEFTRDTLLPEVSRRLRERKGLDTFFYGNFRADHTRWETYPALPRYGTPYRGLRNRIAILSEAYAYASFERRVLDTRDFVREVLAYAAERRERIRELTSNADRRSIDTVVLRSRARALPEKVGVLGYIEEERDGKTVSTGEPREYSVELVNEFEPALAIDAPDVYLVPSAQESVVANLRRHGVELLELREDLDLDLAVYRITGLERAQEAFQGHHLARVEVERRKETARVEAGTLVVPVNQPLGALAAFLLEPQSEDGLCAWGLLGDAIAAGKDYPVRRWSAPQELGPSFLLTRALPPLPRPGAGKLPLTFERVYESKDPPRLFGHAAGGQVWIDAGTYTQVKDGALHLIDARTGRSKGPAFDRETIEAGLGALAAIGPERARSIASRTSHRLNSARTGALLEHGRDLYYHAVVPAGKAGDALAVRLTSTPEREELASFSPDGRWVAFVRDSDLWVVDIATQTSRALTTGGSEDLRSGKASWVYFEEVFNRSWKTYWWSPNSRAIAFLRTDSSGVDRFTIADDLPEAQRVERTAYPKPGTPNPRVELGIAPVSGEAPRWIDLSALDDGEVLVTGVGWWPDSRGVYFFAQDRVQTRLDFCSAPARGGRPEVLFRQRTKAWVDPPLGPFFLEDGSFLVTSERSGWRHLEHRERDGSLRRVVTAGEWEVRSVERVDEKAGWIFITATRDSHIAGNLYRVRLDGSAIERLTAEPGSHRTSVGPEGRFFIDRWSSHRHPTRVALRDGEGRLVRMIDTNPVPDLDRVVLSPRELVTIETPDGFPLAASIVKPPDFDPERRYPVWFSTYAGPHAPTVRDSWSYRTAWDQTLAQSGIVVFRCDPRSASGRGAVSAWSAYRQLGVVELRDIETAIRWLTSHPWVDASRIGMSGHSYGGFMTAYALTHSTLFAAGIAGAPVTDWRDYDTIYTERYMLTPQRNPEGYERTSVVAAAGNLHGRLLILHGLVDDNVHLQNTTRLVAALQRAGKDFELMLYPGSRHGIGGRHHGRLRWEFIQRTINTAGAAAAGGQTASEGRSDRRGQRTSDGAAPARTPAPAKADAGGAAHSSQR